MSEDVSSAAVMAGLSEGEAQARLKREGCNELPRAGRRTPFRIVLEVMREPMLALLAGGGAVYLALGDLREALILLAFAMVSIVITVVQETRTERVLEALRDLTSPRALVIRGGERKRIAGREVVRGDLVVLSEGDRVPADAVLLQATDLQADESLLTGESVPVRKVRRPGAAAARARPGGDDLPFVFSGALVVRGAGFAEVTATGVRSEIGKIGQSLSAMETEPPRLRAQTQKLVRLFALVGRRRERACRRAVRALARRLARCGARRHRARHVDAAGRVSRRAHRVHGDGRVAHLARPRAHAPRVGDRDAGLRDRSVHRQDRHPDPQPHVDRRVAPEGRQRPRGRERRRAEPCLCRIAALGHSGERARALRPMEKAFHELGAHARVKTADGGALVRAYGLRPELLAVTHVWRDGGGFLIASKGAPEAIARLCRAGAGALAAIKAAVDGMAAEGLRVLGVARARFDGETLPDDPQGFSFEFLGLVGLADPLRESVPAAVAECRSAGIRVVMITGDYPATARAIAKQAGLESRQLMTGEELAKCTDDDLTRRVRRVTVFARIMPEQKLRVVNALKANGEIVAMTGDGVNDAPSLKAAHIGIAMGGRGTDVAREASSIVLLDDDFGSVVKAVRLGRRIYDNLRKAMEFIFAVHVPIAGLALLPLVFGLPIIFSPIHIAFLEMVIDPVCTLVFEAETEEEDIMRRPPRSPDEPMFSRRLIWWSVLQGAVAFALVAAIYVIAWRRGMPEAEARALAFFSLVTAIVALIFVNRSFSASLATAFARPNTALKYVIAGVVGILALTLAWPVAAQLFRFGPLRADDLALTLGAGVLILLILNSFKPRWVARTKS